MRRVDFLPARPNPGLIRCSQALINPILRGMGILGVDYDPAELERLQRLRVERILLAPNHPTNAEPALLFHLSRMLHQPFYYLACRESFDASFGLWGKLIQRLGAFSIVRGTADRASFRATRQLLAQPGTKVVIFPEGEVYSQNDSLLPFHDGVFQLAFWALEDLVATTPQATLYIQPVAIKYVYTSDMRLPILWSLSRLERFTGSPVAKDAPVYERLRGIGFAMLRSLEREYRLPTPKADDPESDFTPRLMAVKEAILQRVALAVGVPDPRGETLPERMRVLIHAIHTVTHDAPQDKTPYDRELHRLQQLRAAPLLRDLDRIANWIAVYDGYVRENPTSERIADLLIRLERECFGRTFLWGPRRCRITLPEPLSLAEHLESYRTQRRATVLSVTREIESRIQTALTAS